MFPVTACQAASLSPNEWMFYYRVDKFCFLLSCSSLSPLGSSSLLLSIRSTVCALPSAPSLCCSFSSLLFATYGQLSALYSFNFHALLSAVCSLLLHYYKLRQLHMLPLLRLAVCSCVPCSLFPAPCSLLCAMGCLPTALCSLPSTLCSLVFIVCSMLSAFWCLPPALLCELAVLSRSLSLLLPHPPHPPLYVGTGPLSHVSVCI